MPCADSGQSLDWFTAVALNTPPKGENASAVISESSRVLDKTAPLWHPDDMAPWRAGAGNPQDRFHEATIVLAAPTWTAGLAGKQRCDSLPLPIVQHASIQGWPPFSSLESNFAAQGNPR